MTKEVTFTQRKKRRKIFGFIIGENKIPIEISATTEKKALVILIDRFWDTISAGGEIKLLGKLQSRIIK